VSSELDFSRAAQGVISVAGPGGPKKVFTFSRVFTPEDGQGISITFVFECLCHIGLHTRLFGFLFKSKIVIWVLIYVWLDRKKLLHVIKCCVALKKLPLPNSGSLMSILN